MKRPPGRLLSSGQGVGVKSLGARCNGCSNGGRSNCAPKKRNLPALQQQLTALQHQEQELSAVNNSNNVA